MLWKYFGLFIVIYIGLYKAEGTIWESSLPMNDNIFDKTNGSDEGVLDLTIEESDSSITDNHIHGNIVGNQVNDKHLMRNSKVQYSVSVTNLAKSFNNHELTFWNKYHNWLALSRRVKLIHGLLRRNRPSKIRQKFAREYIAHFGGSQNQAMKKLRMFEKRLNLVFFAAERLTKSQISILKASLDSISSLIMWSQQWRYQPTYISQPILVLSNKNFAKIKKLCIKEIKKSIIVIITASPSYLDEKFFEPDYFESIDQIGSIDELLHRIVISSKNFSDSDNSEVLMSCSMKSESSERSRYSKRKCKSRIKYSSFAHIHFSGVSDIYKFRSLIQQLSLYSPYKSNIYTRPLFIVPILLGMPQIDTTGTILSYKALKTRKKRKRAK
ncbi:uncharacterized protein CMU_038140 [Cryptosporidium muris RN66]|uniref:Uncharacterized protein n=1 Tax=Cryptosporidium muris (strain RN66) TaxID=441375 RepID=B6A957_CRYMR|nr:uncharacterized protein CMU_038140 [Cryptosporidium muris RN66]EEA04748.1 hypothetical protein, conserved [Cryptosporidium muris RN66]|eukprot:XP_002139097.1 hypothetical protein [Cryptosporidium muris RN66]